MFALRAPRARGLLCLLGIGLGACSMAPRPGTLSPATASRLQAVLEQAAVASSTPGMVMAVQVGQGEPWLAATGCQDPACTAKMTPEVTFRVGSITKSFVGAAILAQVDEGKLHLEDTLEQWLPQVMPHVDGRGITLRQLLDHTSGIENFTDTIPWNLHVYQTPTRPWDAPGELLALADALRAANPTVSPPGARFSYSNTNYVLLGMIAAKADGHPVTQWRTVIQERFLTRLGLRHSRLPERGDVGLGSGNRGSVNFYQVFLDPQTGTSACEQLEPPCTDTDVDFTEQDVSSADAAGALISTAEDLLVWTRALTEGDILSSRIRQRQRDFSRTCSPGAPGCGDQSVQVGLGLFRQPKYGLIGIRGEIFGFNGTIQYLPEKSLTIVILGNRTPLTRQHVGDVSEAVVEAIYPELVLH